MPAKKLKIATLCCCYNRVVKTAKFLESLTTQQIPNGYTVDMYLLDDNSPDRTADYVKSNFPVVNVIEGSGSLFWAGGMRTLWAEVLKRDQYDFFLLLNDDVVLMEKALSRLIAAYEDTNFNGSILLGTVLDPKTNLISYGGQKMTNRLTGYSNIQEPDPEKLLPVDMGNANILLVDKYTVDKMGILSDLYTHGFADYEYTFVATKKKLKLLVAPGYYGYCENDHGLHWLSNQTTLKQRIKHLYSPKGLAFKEYLVYARRNFPLTIPAVIFKSWLKTLFPIFYDTFKKTV